MTGHDFATIIATALVVLAAIEAWRAFNDFNNRR